MANILVLDDDENIRNLSQTILTKAGHTVRAFDNVDDAIQFVKGEAPDVILLDGILPVKDGVDFLHEFAPLQSAKKSRIVFMSDMLDLNETKVPAGVIIAAKADKPFGREMLLELVDKALKHAT